MKTVELIEDFRWVSPAGGFSPFLWFALAGVLACLLAAVILWWLGKRRRLAAAGPPEPPAHVVALAGLAKLRSQLDAERYREFIVEVSHILRQYIQSVFDLRALHRSTEEFLMEAAENPELTPVQQSRLGDFLRQCDLVKFARRRTALERMNALLDAAEDFVKETLPKAEPAPATS